MMIKCPECNRGYGKWMKVTRNSWLKNVEMTTLTRYPKGLFDEGPNWVRDYTCEECDKKVRVYLNKCENCYEFCDSLTPDAEGYLSCDDCHIEDEIERIAEDDAGDAYE